MRCTPASKNRKEDIKEDRNRNEIWYVYYLDELFTKNK